MVETTDLVIANPILPNIHQPIISVVMCVYNRSALLKRAIRSIVEQTYKDWELIIVDDGSEEDIKAIVSGFNDSRIIYLRIDKNSGVPVARNLGNAIARGRYIAVADSDDINYPDRLQVEIDTLVQNPGIDVVYSSAYVIYPDDVTTPSRLFEALEWDLFKMLYQENLCFHPTVMFRKKCLETAKYNEKYRYGSDYVFLANLAINGHNFKKISKPLIRYMRHKASISRANKDEQIRMSKQGIAELAKSLPKDWQGMQQIKGVNDFSFELSIIIPAYKNAAELQRTLAALCYQLYDKDAYELIICDDGTPDDSVKRLAQEYSDKGLHIQYFWNPDKGYTLCNARNAGLCLANADILAFLDADMVPEQGFVRKVINLHLIESNLMAIHARNQIDENGLLLFDEDRDITKEPWRLMGGGNISIRLQNAQLIGKFDANYNLDWGLEDADWALRAIKLGIEVRYVSDIVASHIGTKTFKSPRKNVIYFKSKWAQI